MAQHPAPTMIEVYTDGSKIEKEGKARTGAGVVIYQPHNEIEVIAPLAPTNIINQAEMHAINVTAKKLYDLNLSGQKIRIHTDSQTTLTRLTRGYCNSKQLTETIENLQALQNLNEVEIVKVKVHANIPGNERADELAKEATNNSSNTKNFLYWTKTQITQGLADYYKSIAETKPIEKNYNNFTTAIMTKLDNDYGKLWIADKKTMRSLTLAISGQNNLNSSLAHRDPKENPNCPLCNKKQNSEHVLINCPDLEYLRYKLDYQNIQQNIYENDQILEFGKLTALIKKSDLFD